jgi:hypothetical protein
MKRSLLFAAALALTLAAVAQSRADTMPTTFWYNWTRNPISIGTVQQANPGQAGTGGINLLDLNSNAIQAEGETGTPAADVQVISSATSANKDMIAVGGGKYTLTLTLSDQNPASNAPGTHTGIVSFTGQLQGNVTADSSNLTNTILGSTDAGGTHAGQNWAQVQVGDTLYTVTYSGFAEPGPSNEHTFGAISFHITQAPATSGGKSPEPTSLVLGCLGLTCLGGVVWRARRRKAAALKALA